jgi:hypothetical protein
LKKAKLNLANHFAYMAGRRRFVAVNPDPDLMKASVDQMNFSVITRPDIGARPWNAYS